MQELVTFDFDDTLTTPTSDGNGGFTSGGSTPNKETLTKLKELSERGYEIAIVTSRIDTQTSKNRISTFIMEHELPISRGVIFTNGDWKAATLEELGSVLHYDDDPEELRRIEERGISVVEILQYVTK